MQLLLMTRNWTVIIAVCKATSLFPSHCPLLVIVPFFIYKIYVFLELYRYVFHVSYSSCSMYITSHILHIYWLHWWTLQIYTFHEDMTWIMKVVWGNFHPKFRNVVCHPNNYSCTYRFIILYRFSSIGLRFFFSAMWETHMTLVMRAP